MLISYLETHYSGGIFCLACEAGLAELWFFFRLREMELGCIMVNPTDIPKKLKKRTEIANSLLDLWDSLG